jgi:LptA/(LptD N-terminal domain) LPS transport protein
MELNVNFSMKKLFTLSVLFLAMAESIYAFNTNPAGLTWKCLPTSEGTEWKCETMKVPPADKTLSQALGWIPDTTDTTTNLSFSMDCSTCGGHYYLPPLPQPEMGKKGIDEVPSNISADKVNYHIDGAGTLTGNVLVIQPGRVLQADTATLYQKAFLPTEKSKVSRIAAHGNLSVQQVDTLVLADDLDADLFSHKTEIKNVT